MIKAVKGMKDILPGEVETWQFVEEKARKVLGIFGFREIKIPILEKTELFARGIGETTDIVEKEMYTFLDNSGESLTLRPEATASIVRAYIENGCHVSDPIAKFFFIGPMFRYERPQKGRYRQFYQIDAETLGSGDPRTDAEFIELLRRFFFEVGIYDLEFQVNTLGCARCRPAFKKALMEFLGNRKSSLCSDCHRRLERNPLRIYDCKVKECQDVLEGAPIMSSFVCGDCGDHFKDLQDYLSLLEMPYIVNDRIVRGLDYYTKTTFEVIAHGIGAQNAVCGGGRYDMLMKELDGPDLPGIGFAIGMDRVVSMIKNPPHEHGEKGDLFVAALGPEAERRGFQIVHEMRKRGLRTEMDYQKRSLKAQMRRADRLAARYVLILGEREISTGKAVLRDMVSKKQDEISLEGIEGILETYLEENFPRRMKDS